MTERHDDYLWDRGGTPDPELARLEDLLGTLAQQQPPPPLNFAFRQPLPPRRWIAVVTMAAAAVVVTGLVGLTWWMSQQSTPGFAVTRVAGTPRVGNTPVTASGELRVGGWLETPLEARATVDVGDIGRVDLEPGSRVGLVRNAPGDYRLHLARGTMHAIIWAPPGQFTVETPSSTAIDLGCASTLTGGNEGGRWGRATSGRVGRAVKGREPLNPARHVLEKQLQHFLQHVGFARRRELAQALNHRWIEHWLRHQRPFCSRCALVTSSSASS